MTGYYNQDLILEQQAEIEKLQKRNAELAAKNEELINKVKALASQLWRFRKIFRSDAYDAVSSANSLREVAMIVDLPVDQMLAEHDREVAARAVKSFTDDTCGSRRSDEEIWLSRKAENYVNKIKSVEVKI